MPTLGVHLDEETADKVKARAKESFYDKTSTYIRELIQRDLEGESTGVSDPMDPDVLVRLIADLCGKPAARDAQAQMEGIDQPSQLQALLTAWLQRGERGGKHPLSAEENLAAAEMKMDPTAAAAAARVGGMGKSKQKSA